MTALYYDRGSTGILKGTSATTPKQNQTISHFLAVVKTKARYYITKKAKIHSQQSLLFCSKQLESEADTQQQWKSLVLLMLFWSRIISQGIFITTDGAFPRLLNKLWWIGREKLNVVVNLQLYNCNVRSGVPQVLIQNLQLPSKFWTFNP